MKRTLHATTLAAFLALAWATMPGALAADSGEQAQETKARLDAARSEVAKIRNQVGLTLEELNRMQKASVELRPQLDKYSAELLKMEEQARMARARAMSMSEKGQAYFQAWEDTINSIANEDIRKQAQKRYEKRVKSYNKIVKAMLAGRDELQPFMSNLNDLKKLFDSELSRESVKSGKDLIRQANRHGDAVIKSLKAVESELDRVSAELAKYQITVLERGARPAPGRLPQANPMSWLQHYNLRHLLRNSIWIRPVFSLFALSGCKHLGPKTVAVDRFDYGTAIADSWKQRTLLNIVKPSPPRSPRRGRKSGDCSSCLWSRRNSCSPIHRRAGRRTNSP